MASTTTKLMSGGSCQEGEDIFSTFMHRSVACARIEIHCILKNFDIQCYLVTYNLILLENIFRTKIINKRRIYQHAYARNKNKDQSALG